MPQWPTLILIDLVVKMDKNSSSTIFVEEYKYNVKENQMSNFIDKLEWDSSDESDCLDYSDYFDQENGVN